MLQHWQWSECAHSSDRKKKITKIHNDDDVLALRKKKTTTTTVRNVVWTLRELGAHWSRSLALGIFHNTTSGMRTPEGERGGAGLWSGGGQVYAVLRTVAANSFLFFFSCSLRKSAFWISIDRVWKRKTTDGRAGFRPLKLVRCCWPVENVFFFRAARAFSQTAKVELLRISQLPYPFHHPPTTSFFFFFFLSRPLPRPAACSTHTLVY